MIGKYLSNEYSKKIIYIAQKSTTDAINSASKRSIREKSETTGDLNGNKIVDKISVPGASAISVDRNNKEVVFSQCISKKHNNV